MRRRVMLDGKEMYFCPTNVASIVKDCVNDYLKGIANRRKELKKCLDSLQGAP